jgi:predicted nucleotidyltransferase
MNEKMEKETKTQILKVIVGSQAHGLATPESDFDYRGVFVIPTEKILSLGSKTMQTSWIEGKDDDTSWEIGHFLSLATHCNPTILETFLAPTLNAKDENLFEEKWGGELRALFPHIWNSTDVKNAFIGYGFNQRKKFLEDKDNRAPKYAAAFLRTLFNAYELLSTGTFHVDLRGTEIYDTVKNFKEGNYSRGEVIDACYTWQTKVEDVYRKNPNKEANLEPVNEFLLKVRRKFWS